MKTKPLREPVIDPPKFAGSLLQWPVLLLLATLSWVTSTQAQLPLPASSQFTIVGTLDNATLNSPLDLLSGGTVTVNGQVIIVPKNTIVEMPAAALTWQQVFAQAPAPYGIPGTLGVTATVPETGWSLADTNGTPAPLHNYEFTVVGNRVINAAGDNWIAALIYISQASLNSGQGYINFINYANAELEVGGVLNQSGTGTRIRINDPIITTAGDPHFGRGRFSRGQSPDPRFTCDQGNPTISSVTGYPMGIPLTATGDTLCPDVNRPLNVVGGPFPLQNGLALGVPQTSFTMPAVATAPVPGAPVASATPWLEAPLQVGDYITFVGTLVQDGDPTRGPTTGPMPPNGIAGTYISAHTINNNVAIYTAPGTTPAYVIINVTILGTGGTLIAGVAEATARTRFEGFCTDVGMVRPGGTPGKLVAGSTTGTDNVHLFAMDINPLTGVTSDRDWGSSDVDPGAPIGAAKGRWRLRPPGKVVTHPAAGAYVPPTRSVRAALSFGEIVEGTQPQPQAFTLLPWVTTGNGLLSGQYNAPIFEYLFPEQILGNPIPPINPEGMGFLAQGIGPLNGPGTVVSASNPLVGQLAPWPGAVAPATAVIPPTAKVVSASVTV
ncbi:MAG: hypothetical protein NT154_18405, partial [Verrucomicrobia bacterium]|nr:hypothetical protein [Verrucomicrobiota bacterium]